jgi:hypothetical protein
VVKFQVAFLLKKYIFCVLLFLQRLLYIGEIEIEIEIRIHNPNPKLTRRIEIEIEIRIHNPNL